MRNNTLVYAVSAVVNFHVPPNFSRKVVVRTRWHPIVENAQMYGHRRNSPQKKVKQEFQIYICSKKVVLTEAKINNYVNFTCLPNHMMEKLLCVKTALTQGIMNVRCVGNVLVILLGRSILSRIQEITELK